MSNIPNKSAFVPSPVKIWLGQGDSLKEYQVVPAAWAKLFKLKEVLRSLLADVTNLWNAEIIQAVQDVANAPGADAPQQLKKLMVNEQLWGILDAFIEKPQEVLVLAIPDLDPQLFAADNATGITINQVVEAFTVVLEVNRLDVIKKLLAGLTTNTTK